MVKKIRELAAQWIIASLLLFTQIHAQMAPASATCEPNNRFWADVDYLYWKIQSSPEPTPLVIQGATSVVLGGKKIDTGWRSGARAALGYWFICNPSARPHKSLTIYSRQFNSCLFC